METKRCLQIDFYLEFRLHHSPLKDTYVLRHTSQMGKILKKKCNFGKSHCLHQRLKIKEGNLLLKKTSFAHPFDVNIYIHYFSLHYISIFKAMCTSQSMFNSISDVKTFGCAKKKIC